MDKPNTIGADRGIASRCVVRRGVQDHEFPHIYNIAKKGNRPCLECSCGAAYSFGSIGTNWQAWLEKHGSECA